MTKTDVTATATGAASTTALGLGHMDIYLAILVARTACLLLIRIGLAIREWRLK